MKSYYQNICRNSFNMSLIDVKPDLPGRKMWRRATFCAAPMQLNLHTKYKKRILIDVFYVNKKNEI